MTSAAQWSGPSAQPRAPRLRPHPSSVSFLQTPAWAAVKNEWRGESIGWFDGDTIVGAALVLYRQLPQLKRYLAYLPEGPDIDWTDADLDRWLDADGGAPRGARVRSASGWARRS